MFRPLVDLPMLVALGHTVRLPPDFSQLFDEEVKIALSLHPYQDGVPGWQSFMIFPFDFLVPLSSLVKVAISLVLHNKV